MGRCGCRTQPVATLAGGPKVRSEFLPFSRPDITEEEIAAVAEVLRSGWITTGPRCAELEERFAARVQAAGAVALASATGGMHLLLHVLGIGPGDEVVTPSMTWASTANLIVLAGATPVFVDVDRDTLMADADAFAAAITERTRLLIPVHYAGAAADVDPIREVARRHGVEVIEDAAHAIGTTYRGRPVGRVGTTVFSFHPIKNLTTGEGGAVCADAPEILERVRRVRFHGLGVDAYDREMQGRSPQAEVMEPGYKYNLTDMAAALGLAQLARLEDLNRRRAELAGIYRELLAGVDEVLPLADPTWPMDHAWHLFVVRLDSDRAGMDRTTFMAELKRRNIGSGIHFRAIHTHRYYREHFPQPAGALSNTDWNSERIVSLPLFPAMTPDDVRSVVDAIKEILTR